MPIQWPPVDRYPQFAPQDDVPSFAIAFDITNLVGIGREFDGSILDPGIGLDDTRGVNVRNLGFQFETPDINSMAPPPIIQVSTGRGVYNQTDWYNSNSSIIGVTRDSAGVVLGSCQVDLFSSIDVVIASVISDVSGNFSFSNPGTGPFYIVAYRTGAPDVAGVSVNTLLPTLL